MKSYTRTKHHTTFGDSHYPGVKEMVMTSSKLCIQCLLPIFYFIVFWCHHKLMLFWFSSLHLRMQNSSPRLPLVVSKPDCSRCRSRKEGRMGSTTSLRRGSPPYCCQTNILAILQHPGQSRSLDLNCHSLGLQKHSQSRKLHHSQCSVVL